VLSIAVGVFAVGVIQSSAVMLKDSLNDTYWKTNPHSATLYTDNFDDNLLQTLRRSKLLEEADARSAASVRFKVGKSSEWQNLNLTGIANFNDIRINKFKSESGAWPPGEDEILFEHTIKGIQGMENISEGDTISIETPSNDLVKLKVAGFVHDPQVPSATFTGTVFGYVTLDTMEHLGLPRTYNQLNVIVAKDKLNEKHIRDVAATLRDDKLEPSGVLVRGINVPEPGKSVMYNPLSAMTMILSVLSILSLMLSAFLVVNTISAILTQQTKQIGIMKSVGGIKSQVIGLFYSIILIYGILALFVSIPLGSIGAKAFANYTANLLNFKVENYSTPTNVLFMEIGVGLLVPALAALFPIIQGTRISVREAIFSYGLSNMNPGKGLIDRILVKMRWLSRPMLISIRNTFRRKGRLALTLTTLMLGAAVFISVITVRSSLLNTMETLMQYWKYDVRVQLEKPQRFSQIEHVAKRINGIERVENWSQKTVTRIRPDGTENEQLLVIASPAGTPLISPNVLEGRWLVPTDKEQIVVNSDVIKDEKDITLGSDLTLKIGAKKTRWHVVGIVKGALSGPIMYINQPYFAQIAETTGQTSFFVAQTRIHDAEFQNSTAKALEERLKKMSARVTNTETNAGIREQITNQFNVLIVFLMIMAVLLAVVGGLGLMGTMSINVLERTREIGVMRAVGASNFSVFRIFITEGLIIGIVSWFLGTILSVPLSQFLSNVVGNAFMHSALDYKFSPEGVFIWLAIVLIISCAASFMPAWRAVRISVRDTLSYE
jgi:putative ABC transport system permease protein